MVLDLFKIEFSNKAKEGNNVSQQSQQNNSPNKRKSSKTIYDNRRSRSFEHSVSQKKDSRSPSREFYGDKVSSLDIRKQYKNDFYKPGEFHEKTPKIDEIEAFLSSNLDQAYSTVISTSKRHDKYIDSRRRERRYDDEDRDRGSRRAKYDRDQSYNSDVDSHDIEYSKRDMV